MIKIYFNGHVYRIKDGWFWWEGDNGPVEFDTFKQAQDRAESIINYRAARTPWTLVWP